MIIGLILFVLLGLALGYGVPGPSAWLGLLVPVAFALLTAVTQGLEAELVLQLILALVIMAAAIVAGRLIDRYFARRSEAEGGRAS